MPYLKKVTINNNDYFYLFHTIRDGEKFRKASKYIGKKEPSEKELKKLKEEFISEISKEPIKYREEVIKPNVVAILQDLQEKEGYLSKDSMMKLSGELGIPGVDIYGVATFYSQFNLKKHGKYKVSVCSGTACHVNGSNKVIELIEGILDIKTGETTKDHKVTLEKVNCIGACAKGPAMMVNGIVYGQLDDESTKKIIHSLK